MELRSPGTLGSVGSQSNIPTTRLGSSSHGSSVFRSNAAPSTPARVDVPSANVPQILAQRGDNRRFESRRIESPQIQSRSFESPQIQSRRIESPQIPSRSFESRRIESPQIPSRSLESRRIETPSIGGQRIESPRIELRKNDSRIGTDPSSSGLPRTLPNLKSSDGQAAERLRDRILKLPGDAPASGATLGQQHADGPNTGGLRPVERLRNEGMSTERLRQRLELNPGAGTPSIIKTPDGRTEIVRRGSGLGDLKPGEIGWKPSEQIRSSVPRGLNELARQSFGQRRQSGQLDRVTAGKVAEFVKLGDQYKFSDKGDIARRLNLNWGNYDARFHHGKHDFDKRGFDKHDNFYLTKLNHVYHGGRPYYHGLISSHYVDHCFKRNYWGPSWFYGIYWYPRWHLWVDWSWRYRCHPLWDPRPIFCRPIVYDPCPAWVYWNVPVYDPLPVVTCGTWVDVERPIVRQAFDIQLLAVRFVDPGHPDENLGPRYRVWYRNNSDRPITSPFNVTLLASNDGKLAATLPQAGVQVTSIEAGDTQSVDVRLPIEAFRMNRDAAGEPVPFETLHVLVDANRAIEEENRGNNGTNVSRAEVLPVDPAVFAVDPNRAAAGSELVLAGEGLGPAPGRVLVNLGGIEYDAEIRGWYDLGVRFGLPNVPLATPTEAEVVVIRGDSAAANPVKITIEPPQSF
ncbi:MAG: hypothetical protein ACOY3P_09030 [Planctomycetota bacterium]